MKFIKNLFKIVLLMFSLIGILNTIKFFKKILKEVKNEMEEMDLFEDDEYGDTIILNPNEEEHAID